MTKPIKKTSPRDEAELVEVHGSTEAEVSSHRSRKRYRPAKIVEASSDQTQKGGRRTEVEYRSMVLGSSEHISNGVSGMSKQEILAEFKKTREHLEELRRENEELRREKEELNSRVTDIETMIRAMTPKK
ncbi:hypothetical protein SLEP1_g18580 [Rubroshorea leprosula]|uniref:Uncharacterized protein n=2 Tax=Rubroshorea leprosula TaxID=152421 RepID=A0AAV5J1H3_9ROSI|nr:hypothetical protein SLEP1_g18580 [Rubroshorea leprosula]